MANQLQQVLNRILQNKKSNLTPVNLREGVRCLGIDGNLEEGVDTTDATASSQNILAGETAYVNGEKVEGTMPNLGELVFAPSDEEHTTTSGYTEGIKVEAADITKLEEYKACLELAESVDTEKDFSDATAVASDIVEGKIAYAKGERVIGTYKPVVTFDGTPSNNAFSIKSESITKIDLTSIDTSMYTNFYNAFSFNPKLKSITGLNVSNATSLSYMFWGDTALTSISNFDTRLGKAFQNTFANCSSLQTIEGVIDISNASSSTNMFYKCGALKSLNLTGMVPSNAANMFQYGGVYDGTISLDLTKTINAVGMLEGAFFKDIAINNYSAKSHRICYGNKRLKKVTFNNCNGGISYGFEDCSNLEEVNIDGKITSAFHAFDSCSKIKTVNALDLSECDNAGYLFYRCTNLVDVPILDLTNCSGLAYPFSGCPNLSDASLNNIMISVVNCSAAQKSFSWLGFDNSQVERCKSFPAYQTLIDAGWN